jgi:predicted component of type VI protein secretion system
LFIAKLIPLDSIVGNSEGVQNLTQSKVHIGSDPLKADLVINDLSVNDAQAIIIHSKEGFWINDLDSSGGTWVNYIKIGRQPVRVQSGDIIHFGNCGFRFSVLEYGRSQKVTYSKYEPML